MNIPIQVRTSAALLSAAVLVTGCCGPKRDRTAMYYQSTPSSTAYSDARMDTTRTDVAETTTTTTREQDRTQVRGTADTQREWSLPLYSEELRVGKREVENGSVRLRKTVRSETAKHPIELQRETVVIDRQAFEKAREAADAGRPNEFGAAFQEKEIVIDLKREEPVVEVQQYISGRILAEKRRTTDRQEITRQVRHEEIDIVKSGNDRDIVVSENVRARNEAVGRPGAERNRESGAEGKDVKRDDPKIETQDDTSDDPDRAPAKGGAADLQPNKLQTDKTR